MDPAAALHELRAYVRFPSVMLVGHQPDLGILAAMLLGMESPYSLHVRKSLLAAIDCGENPRAGLGVLEFFLPAKLMD
jgi:phosphohistidine phosphatase SixA